MMMPDTPRGLVFRKSTHSSGTGECVEVAEHPSGIFVRDSKDPQGAVLGFTPSEFAAFIGGVKDGEFDF